MSWMLFPSTKLPVLLRVPCGLCRGAGLIGCFGGGDISESSQQLEELLTNIIDKLAPSYILDHRGRG